MRGLDIGSWQGLLSTLLGIVLITLVGVGIRLVLMMTWQQKRERENRQINERLRTLIAAYKTLGGSFTGDLSVDPTHLRDLRAAGLVESAEGADRPGSDRGRRMRDAVEAALSDIILLGTDDQVRLAAMAASELAAGRPVHTAELVASLRDFIRSALGLAAIPAGVAIPRQGPARPSSSGGGGNGRRGEGGGGGGRGGGGGGGMAAGMGMGGLGLGLGSRQDDPAAEPGR